MTSSPVVAVRHYPRKRRLLSLIFRILHCPFLTQAEPDPGMASASTTMHTTTIAEPDPGMSGWPDGRMETSTPTIMDIVVIAGVIAAVAIVLVSLLFVMLRYMYRHKGTYHTNEAKGTEFAESADAALQGDPALQDAGDSSRKEYFI
ncbi:glycophorin-C isoform X1 [Homo sapiens]|nr:glycophorin-C isoform X1 [Homo sapiens]XP_054197540.1 glycophorin-C isoform X1 [Homo sapiens]